MNTSAVTPTPNPPQTPAEAGRIELLPCPFCGSEQIDPAHWRSLERHGPGCRRCAATADTAQIWNTRTFAAALSAGSPSKAGEDDPGARYDRRVRLSYTNWRGELAEREIAPIRVFWGSNQWHLEPQWLIEAWDTEKHEIRTFALKGIGAARPATHRPAPVAAPGEMVDLREYVAVALDQAKALWNAAYGIAAQEWWRGHHHALFEVRAKIDHLLATQPAGQDGADGRLARAERALKRASFTYTEGADEWRPPLGPNPSPLLARIDELKAQAATLDAAREDREAELLATIDALLKASGFVESRDPNDPADPIDHMKWLAQRAASAQEAEARLATLAQGRAGDAVATSWEPMETAPQRARPYVILELESRVGHRFEMIAHWAQDLSGEEQPPFRGWFYDYGSGFAEVPGKPRRWRVLPAAAPQPAGETQEGGL